MSKVTMNVSQWEQLKEQYCEIVVDSMDMKSLVIYAQEQMGNYMDSLSYKELKEEVDNYDSDLFDELVDNVTQQYPKQVNNFGG
tara:strand:- start:92 stop:343 length:252 start_codon:yes stop_codon:yes gene_type:complete